MFSVSKRYTEGQIERIKESIRIREEAVPTELLKAVRNRIYLISIFLQFDGCRGMIFWLFGLEQVMRLRKEMAEQEKSKLKLPPSLKQKVARDIIQKLRSLREGSNSTDEIGWFEKFMQEHNLILIFNLFPVSDW